MKNLAKEIVNNIQDKKLNELAKTVNINLMQKVAEALPAMKKAVSKAMFTEACGDDHDKEEMNEKSLDAYVVVHTKQKVLIGRFKTRAGAKKKAEKLGKEYEIMSSGTAEDLGFRSGKVK